jgi:hypothetical protein
MWAVAPKEKKNSPKKKKISFKFPKIIYRITFYRLGLCLAYRSVSSRNAF